MKKFTFPIIAASVVITLAIAQETGFHFHVIPWYAWALGGIALITIKIAIVGDKG